MCITKTRKDALSPQVQKQIRDFYERGDIVRINPSQKAVSKKTLKPSCHMEVSIKQAHELFLRETSGEVKVSLSTFAALRPKETKPMKTIKLNTCCCEYCLNMDMKIESLNKFCTSKGMRESSLGSRFAAVQKTLCRSDPATGEPRRRCIERTCTDCGTEALRQQLQKPLDNFSKTPVGWRVWETVSQNIPDKEGGRKIINKKMLNSKEGPLEELVSNFIGDTESFCMHISNASWQHRQLDKVSKNVPEDTVVMVCDFAENFTCFFQDEVQSVHWTRNQVTIHPLVTYYRCRDDGLIIKESFIAISDDLKHDCHAVYTFMARVITMLRSRGQNFNKVIQFSDGCTGQYKGKTAFLDLSFAEEELGVTIERHFFGTRHGKSVCDGEIGMLKRCSSSAVKAGKVVIGCAEDLYKFCKEKLSLPSTSQDHAHNKRTIFFVKDGTIQRERRGVAAAIKTVPGTRSLHCIVGVEPFVVMARERSCFCQACVSPKDGEDCQHLEFCGPWRRHSLKKMTYRQQGLLVLLSFVSTHTHISLDSTLFILYTFSCLS